MMKRNAVVGIAAAVAIGAAALAASTYDQPKPGRPAFADAATADRPNVVELFQSQGCSDCPPANAMLNGLADRRDVIALSFAVTYWDRLGWKDTFADPAFTARQWDYAHANRRGNVATPQFVINGRTIVSGANRQALEAALSGPGVSGPPITLAGDKVTIGPGPAREPAIVWLVRYDPRVRQVGIGSGENGGRTLPHRDIVTGLRKVATWIGKPVSFSQPSYRDPNQRSAILIQQGSGGPIIAARHI